MAKKITPWERPIISYDLETTGLKVFPQGQAAEIIEIGAVKGDPQTLEILGEFEVKIFPEHIETASPDSFEFNHYDPKVWEEAVPLEFGLGKFGNFARGGVLLAQNATFDWTFTQEAASRFGGDLERDFGIDYHRLDICSMSYLMADPFWKESNLEGISLSKIGAFLGIPKWEEHTALADAHAGWLVYAELTKWYRNLVNAKCPEIKRLPTNKIFLICPVRNATPEVTSQINAYVENLENEGWHIHWPARDTDQTDKHGFSICSTNFRAMQDAEEIHIWFDPTSYGSVFDEGGLFMLHLLQGNRKVVLANHVEPTPDKSFANVLLRLASETRD